MVDILFQILIVLFLTICNGLFSCAEIALISIRKSKYESLANAGNSRAKIVKQLRSDPESLFATIQIGISFITILASAFAGANIAGQVSYGLSSLGLNHSVSYTVSFILVVLSVAYLNLILGELVPKSLGLRYANTLALYAARPIYWIAKISKGAVKFINTSSNLLLKPFKDATSFTESRLSQEEIRSILEEANQAGTITPHEHEIIENVFQVSDLLVKKIMVPRTRITALDVDEPAENNIRLAIESGYSRVPVFKESLNNTVGILYTKKLLGKLNKGEIQDLNEFLVPPYFVPSSMKAVDVLRRLQRKKLHVAMVTDEHGEVEGLVTLEDILEELVGDIADETDEGTQAQVWEQDGKSLVSGSISIVDFNKHFGSDIPEDEQYTTLSGFISHTLGRFPVLEETVTHGGFSITVIERTQRTVKTAHIKKHDTH
ncbi:MAG TPA: hemolysin family protein [Patescibacteria group bacterium]|nr:hemolysin family protein [Patescibacteria group bacterium]